MATAELRKMHISHIRISKQKISDYVDAVKPVVERYTEIKQEIKEKNTERKQLRAEQDSLPFYSCDKASEIVGAGCYAD